MLFIDPRSDVNANIPNIGLAYAATRSNVPVVDQHILPYPADRFLKHRAEVVGISIRSFTRREAERIRSEYLKRYPGAAVRSVTGFLDVQCCYPYLSWNDEIEYPGEFSDALPFPRYELFDSFNYLSTNWQTGFWAYPLMTSQGCPFQCVFCAARNRRWRPRSAAHSVEELKQAAGKYGIKRFEILDDAFNVNKKRVLEFCELVRPLGLSWSCTNGLRADLFDEDMAKAMAEAGCRRVGFGIETTDPLLLSAIQKGETADDIGRAVAAAKRHIGEVNGFFVIGLPGSTFEKDMASVRWVREQGIRAQFSYFAPDVPSGDTVFYGAAAGPSSDAYPKPEQEKVYAAGRALRRRGRSDLDPRSVLSFTMRGVGKYDANSWRTHLAHLVTKGFTSLFKGEIS